MSSDSFEKLKTLMPGHRLKLVLVHLPCCPEHPEGYYARVGLRGIVLVPRGCYLDCDNQIVPDWVIACKN